MKAGDKVRCIKAVPGVGTLVAGRVYTVDALGPVPGAVRLRDVPASFFFASRFEPVQEVRMEVIGERTVPVDPLAAAAERYRHAVEWDRVAEANAEAARAIANKAEAESDEASGERAAAETALLELARGGAK